jgi:hypothetical protein
VARDFCQDRKEFLVNHNEVNAGWLRSGQGWPYCHSVARGAFKFEWRGVNLWVSTLHWAWVVSFHQIGQWGGIFSYKNSYLSFVLRISELHLRRSWILVNVGSIPLEVGALEVWIITTNSTSLLQTMSIITIRFLDGRV